MIEDITETKLIQKLRHYDRKRVEEGTNKVRKRVCGMDGTSKEL